MKEEEKDDSIVECDLCRLDADKKSFILNTKNGTKYFCCDGCLKVYELLHMDEDE